MLKGHADGATVTKTVVAALGGGIALSVLALAAVRIWAACFDEVDVPPPPPTVCTDRNDYEPGTTANITGSGFQADETVEMLVLHADGTPSTGADHEPWQLTADVNGNFETTWHVCEDDCVGSYLRLTAVGLSSALQAEAFFWDAASNPTPQPVPYAQDFSGLAHTSTTYPAGWLGWRLANSSSGSFRTTDPTDNLTLTASSSASSTAGGVHNYNGKLGFLASGSVDPSLVFAIDATGESSMTLAFDIMTIRNPQDATNTRQNGVDVQFRVGTGPAGWTSLSGLANGVYQNLTGSANNKTTSGDTSGQNIQTVTLSLPSSANNQSVVQIRWVQRDISGAGSRPSFAVDNICVNGTVTISAASSVCANSAGNTASVPNAGSATYTWSITNGMITSGQGTTAITYTAGTTSPVTLNVTVTNAGCSSSGTRNVPLASDSTPPTISCPSDRQLQCGDSTDPSNTGTATATDDCGGIPTVTYSDSAMAANCTGQAGVSRTWRAEDANGNTSTCAQSITFVDTTPPVISDCGTNRTASADANCQTSLPDFRGAVSATDNCTAAASLTKTQSPAAGTLVGLGTTTVTITVKDGCNNATTCTRTFTVSDTTPPAILSCPPATSAIEVLEFDDFQDGSRFGPETSPGLTGCDWFKANSIPAGTTRPLLTVTNDTVLGGAGNLALLMDPVNANEPAVGVSCLHLGELAVGQTVEVMFDFRLFTSSNTSTAALDSASGFRFGLHNSKGEVTADNSAETQDDDGYVVFVPTGLRSTPGVETNLRLFKEFGSSCGPSEIMGASGCDDGNFSSTGLARSVSSKVINDNDRHTGTLRIRRTAMSEVEVFVAVDDVSFSFTDSASPFTVFDQYGLGNNAGTHNWTVDNVVTTLTSCDSSIPDVTADVVTTDNCPGALTITQSPATGTQISTGTHTITVTVTDAAGNTNTCATTFTVDDSTPPAITCPADITAACGTGGSSVVTFVATATDNCDPSPTINCVPPSGNNFPAGTTTVTCTATDDSSNGASCSFTVTLGSSPDCSITGTNVICKGGTTELCGPSGMAGYLWSGPEQNGATSQCITVGTAGNYSLRITAASGCTNTCATTVLLALDWVRPPTPEDGFVTCVGAGNVFVAGTESPGQTFNWDPAGVFSTSADEFTSTNTFAFPAPGIGQIMTVTYGGCALALTGTVVAVDTINPASTNICAGNSATFAVNVLPQGAGFSPGQPTWSLNPADAGNLSTNAGVTVTFSADASYSGPATITAICGTSSNSASVTVLADTTPPIITCSGDQTVECTGSAGAVATYSASATDNCDSAPNVVCTPASGGTFPIGMTSVTCTATDDFNNSASCTFTVTVRDATAPSISCPADQTIVTSGTCTAFPTYLATATDTCDTSPTVVCSPVSGSEFLIGTTTVSCTATDDFSNGASCTFRVTVRDPNPPTISCPSDQTLDCTGPGGAVATFSASASDDCDTSPTVNCSPASGTTFPVGTTTVTCTATDDSANTASCTLHITVRDLVPPSITCPADFPACADPTTGSAVVQYPTIPASDNCDPPAVTCIPPSGSTLAIGAHTVACTATDSGANTASCSFTVMVFADTTAPTITCPADRLVECTSANGATSSFSPTVTDNCDPAPSVVCTPASGSQFAFGTTTVNCTATDRSGNSASCSFTMTVRDNTGPTLNCPGDTVVLTSGGCTASASYTVTATDTCDPNPTVSCFPPISTTLQIGTTTVNCAATDRDGNVSSCSFRLIVRDPSPPTITCPASRTLNCTGNGAVTTFHVSAADDCDVSLAVGCSPPSGSRFFAGTNTVICTATDDSGNSANCSFSVTVIDSVLPTITCPSDIVTCPGPGGSAVVYYPSISGSDNCGSTTVSCSPPSGSTFPSGTTTVTCTAADIAGNSRACSFAVTVRDGSPPVLSCPAELVVTAPNGQCSVGNVGYPVSPTDDCGVAEFGCVPPPGSTFSLGTTMVTCTATDGQGKTTTCSFPVRVMAQPVNLTQVLTGLTNPIDVDHHASSNQVVLSVNYPSGLPHNLELISATGTRRRHSPATQLAGEIKIAAVQDAQGGFVPGEILAGNSQPGQIMRVSADGNSLINPWVVLPGESGLIGGLHVDRTGLFGGDLIAVTISGGVWRVSSSGVASNVASLSVHLEGVTVVPNEPARYGPWAGRILTGAEQQGLIHAIDAQGNSVSFDLGIAPEDFAIIPLNDNFYGVDFGDRILWGARASEFARMVGDILIAQESPGVLYRVRWTGTEFCAMPVAEVDRWQHITFSSAGIDGVPPVSHAPLIGCSSPVNAEACPDGPGASATLSALVSDPDGGTVTVTWNVDGGSTQHVESVTLPGPLQYANSTFTHVYPIGNHNIVVTVEDAAGESAGCSTTVVVHEDNTPPTVSYSNITVQPDAGSCFGTVNSYTNLVVSDACSTPDIDCEPHTPTNFPAGATGVHCTVTDDSGNTQAFYFTVIVPGISTNIAAPRAVCQDASTKASVPDAGVGATYSWILSDGEITTGHGTREITWTSASVGTNTLSVTITTAGGCSLIASRNVTLVGLPDSTITAPAGVCGNTTGHTASVSDAGFQPQYDWSIQNGVIDQGQGTREITWRAGPTGPIILTVTVANAVSCAATATAEVPIRNCSLDDADGDGLINNDEINVHHTDPFNPDTDNDGLTDGEEVQVYGTNPLNSDTDCDGRPDGEEIAVGGGPLDNPLGRCCRTYTSDVDFDEGRLQGVNHSSPGNGQLQLDDDDVLFPFVCVACSGRGTVVRIDANTGDVLGEYLTSPAGKGRNPSRTTVDQLGNVWVANRAEISHGKGSVVRIGLVIGGTRGFKNPDGSFTPDPEGQYLKPPFEYSTCLDRDGDGLIRTSRRMGDILPWTNEGYADGNGGVSTAEDECIINFTRVIGTVASSLAVDIDNNVWVGGAGNGMHEKLSGVTGQPIPGTQFNSSCGGFGGLVDVNGVLWSALDVGSLLRFDPDEGAPPGTGQCFGYGGGYGLGYDPNTHHIWYSGYGQTTLREIDAAGNLLNSYGQPFQAKGVCVDANSHVWMSSAGCASDVWHLAPDPDHPGRHVSVGIVSGLPYPTGVAVDANGKIWSADLRNTAHRIDPTKGPIGGGGYRVGTVDLAVQLGEGADPDNYSDMTGFISKQLSGLWVVTYDSGESATPWGTVSWNAGTPLNSSLRVQVASAENEPDLVGAPLVDVTNGVTFTNVPRGRYLRVQVRFTRGDERLSPVLYDLTVCPAAGFDEPPVAVCRDVTTNAPTGSVFANVTAQQVDSGSTDPENGPLILGLSPSQLFPVGTNLATLTVTDIRGQSDSCTSSVTVTGSVPPLIMCPADLTVTADPGHCYASNTLLGWPFVSDNLGIETIVNDAPAQLPVGSTAVTWTVTDVEGNSASCVQTIAVHDTEPPLLICPPAVAVDPDSGGSQASNIILGVPTVTDNCVVASVASNLPGSLPIGTHAIIWTAVDSAGNSAQCSQTVIVRDTVPPGVQCALDTAQLDAPLTASATVSITEVETVPPTLICPADITVECETNRQAGVTYEVAVFDNCDVTPSLACEPVSGSRFSLGVTTVTCTATDDSANVAICSFNVIVLDGTPPVITCPTSRTEQCSAAGNAVVAFNASAMDGCDPLPTVSCAPPSGSAFPFGVTTVICTAADESQNSATCSFTVTVEGQLPQVTCPGNMTVECSGNAAATANYSATPAGGCGGSATASCEPPSGSSFTKGSTTVTCTATDPAGNIDTCTFIVTVQDTQSPSITCPAGITQNTAAGECTTTVAFNVTASDVCDNAPALACSPASGSIFAEGATTVTCTATDDSGNSASCSFTVTVSDAENPTITCPADVTVNTDPDLPTASNVALGTPTTSDNCAVAGVANNAPTAFPLGTNTVTWTVADTSSNQTACAQRVIVVDIQSPAITCPPNIVTNMDIGQCARSNVTYAATATDNHTVASLVCDPTSGSTFANGATNVTCTASDPAGNSASCWFTVTVNDTESPQITCPGNQTTVSTNACGNTAVFTQATAIDNCGNATVACDPASGSALGPGIYPATCTATDTSDNTNQCGFTLTVLEPLHLVFAPPPLADDNVADNIETDADVVNQFKVGSKIPHKIRIQNCSGNDVTVAIAPSVAVRLDVTQRQYTNTSSVVINDVPENYTGVGSAGGVMVLVGNHFQYNLDTTGYPAGTVNNSMFYRSHVTVEYLTSPGIVVGEEDALLESKP